MRVCVAGGGLAGVLLAWRLAQRPDVRVDLLTGPPAVADGTAAADATAASGGAVRAYETLREQRALALASLVELLASPVLRAWAQYRETGFAYLRDQPAAGTGPELAAELAEIERELPGSAELISPAEAFGDRSGGPGWGRDDDGVVIRERRAGLTSPDGFRDAILADLARRPGVRVRAAGLAPAALKGGTADAGRDAPAWATDAVALDVRAGYDVVVLAAGAWTPGLLRAIGRSADGYRTRSIQYTVYDTGPGRPLAFADERTGLYGLPVGDDGLLLGLPTSEWDVPPGAAPVTLSRHEEAARLAASCFPGLKLGAARRRIAAVDCFCDPPVLALREVEPGQSGPRLFTFTGGSGGAAKSALAASQRAVGRLTGLA